METQKIENWQNGDVFALKITDKRSKYYGMYLILIKVFHLQEYYDKKNCFSFRAKLWQSKELPTLDEINNLEYIKTAYRHYATRFLPIEGNVTYDEWVKKKKHLKFYPDEYNYLYSYYFTLDRKKKDKFDDFFYIGNAIIAPIKEEYITAPDIGIEPFLGKDELTQELPKLYEKYNLKKGDIYDPKQHAIIEKNIELFMKVIKETPKL